MHRW
jgi:hypothetical protein